MRPQVFMNRRATILLLVIMVGAPAARLGVASGDEAPPTAVAAEQATAGVEQVDAIEVALRDDDGAAMVVALGERFTENAAEAEAACVRLMLHPRTKWHPIGADGLARRGDAEAILRAIKRLSPLKQPDARRWLVRALGRHPQAGVEQTLGQFLRDPDANVRAAAAGALANFGDQRVMAHLAPVMPSHPRGIEDWDHNRQYVWAAHAHGACFALTGSRETSPVKIRAWWRQREATLKEEPAAGGVSRRRPAAELSARDIYVSPGYLGTPSFDVTFHHEDDIAVTQRAGAAAELLPFARRLEVAMARARRSTRSLLGPTPLPPVQLHVGDDKTMRKHGGHRGFTGGVVLRMRITIHRENWDNLARRVLNSDDMLHHELVHVRQFAAYVNQPRWMREGLAESLTYSPRESVWTTQRVALAGLAATVKRGVFRRVLAWRHMHLRRGNKGEQPLYRLSHLAIDYLRHGGHPTADARLAFLMGRISRGEHPQVALAALYGRSVRALDAELRRWVHETSRE